MKNNGELKLSLPELPHAKWRWELVVSETPQFSAGLPKRHLDSLFIGVVITDGWEAWYSREEEIKFYGTYDETIAAVQELIDELYDNFICADIEEHTAADALKHIMLTFGVPIDYKQEGGE